LGTNDRSESTSLDAQIEVLKSSGADILLLDVAPVFAARALRKIAELDWHPVTLLDNASASIANALRPAGLQNSSGVISTSFLKDAADPEWTNDPAMKAFLSFMDKYYPDGDKDDGNVAFGYAAAETLFHVLSQCGDDLSRENVMKQSASLKGYHNSIALPGITISTGLTDFHPIKQMRLVQFDGTAWQPIGDVIENAFIGNTNQ
jgi:branched-chain amino acid transport system substrate-binding protein